MAGNEQVTQQVTRLGDTLVGEKRRNGASKQIWRRDNGQVSSGSLANTNQSATKPGKVRKVRMPEMSIFFSFAACQCDVSWFGFRSDLLNPSFLKYSPSSQSFGCPCVQCRALLLKSSHCLDFGNGRRSSVGCGIAVPFKELLLGQSNSAIAQCSQQPQCLELNSRCRHLKTSCLPLMISKARSSFPRGMAVASSDFLAVS